jgi:hypothetical protein
MVFAVRSMLAGICVVVLVLSVCALDVQTHAVSVDRTIHLFNGKDLSSFYTWLVDLKFEDPDSIFTVVDQIDGGSAIRISGQRYSGLITRQGYRNYHLVG